MSMQNDVLKTVETVTQAKVGRERGRKPWGQRRSGLPHLHDQ